MNPLRIGVVAYVNSRPLARGLERWKGDGRYRLVYLPPARLADELAAGRLDVGLLPSVELLRIPGLEVVPGLAIAATREVRSVLLVSRVPIRDIRSLALDENSRTSAALVRIVLEQRYDIRPETAPAAPELETMLASADAALVIGDPALRVDRSRYVVLDLAAEWFELTGLPFVFAVWAARAEVATPELERLLTESLAVGFSELDEIVAEVAAESGLPPEVLSEYFRSNLRFVLADAERRGLEEFHRRVSERAARR